jgi:signal transduction histidine kinase
VIFLIPVYFLFALFVFIKERNNRHAPWFVLTLLGFCVALVGLVLFTEYISYATYSDNPLFQKDAGFIWAVNYWLGLDVEGMYRLMNVGIALYLFGALTFPFSVDTEGRRFGLILVLAAVPAALILADDPALSRALAGSADPFLRKKELSDLLGALNLGLSVVIKVLLLGAAVASVRVLWRIPPILRRRFQFMLLGIIPFHILVFFLFYWYPNHTLVIWRFSLLSPMYFPYGGTLYAFMFGTALVSVLVMVGSMFQHQSLRLTNRHTRLNFSARMKTATTGMRVFSHALKNQFVAARLLSENLLAADLPAEDQRRTAEAIRAICDQGLAKLNSLPLGRDRLALRYTVEDLVPVLGRCVVETPPAVLGSVPVRAFVRVDLACFTEVVHNLLVNAREACEGVGSPRIVLSLEHQFRFVVLTVEDNGCGMDPETLRHAFDPFFSSKPAISNWGLGLPYGKQVVEAFGGAIALESTPGQGTRVTLYLPEAGRG